MSPSRSKKPKDNRPTEKTPKTGTTVPIPKRGEFFANLKKVAGKKREHAESERRTD